MSEVKKLQQSRLSSTPHGKASDSTGGPFESSALTDETSSAPWSEVSFAPPSNGLASSSGDLVCGPRMTFKLLGGREFKLWSEFLALPSDESEMEDLGWVDEMGTVASNLSVFTVDFPSTGHYASPQGLAKLHSLFKTLEKLSTLSTNSAGGIIPILGAKLATLPRGGGRRLAILQERVGRGERLRGVMRVCGRLEGGVARDHLVQVLAGLESLRGVGLTHDGKFLHLWRTTRLIVQGRRLTLSSWSTDISLDTIVLSTTSFGGARLAEPFFRRRIVDLDRSNPFLPTSTFASSSPTVRGDSNEGERLPWNWLSPDEIDAGYAFGHKRDIWHTGICYLRMLVGTDVVYRYANLEAVLESGACSSSLPVGANLHKTDKLPSFNR